MKSKRGPKGKGDKPCARTVARRRVGAHSWAPVLALVCMLVAAGWGAARSAKSGSAQRAPRPEGRGGGPEGLATAPRHGPAGGAPPAATGPRAAVARPTSTPAPSATDWRYEIVVRRNLFMPPAARRQEGPPALPPLQPMPVDLLAVPQVSETAAPPKWTYAGYATVNGNPMAIVEDTATKKAEFLTVGQTLDGSTVSGISPQTIKLTQGSDTTELRLSDAFTATPLNEPPKPAAASTSGQGRRGRGGGGGGFFRGAMPAPPGNGNDPDLADQANPLMQIFLRPDQSGAVERPAPTDGRQPQGGQP